MAERQQRGQEHGRRPPGKARFCSSRPPRPAHAAHPGRSARLARAAYGAPRSAIGWIVRGAALLLLLWILGFVVFVFGSPGPAAPQTMTDGVVVLTGGPQRLARGVDVLKEGLARRLFVSGVDRSVRPRELLEVAKIPPDLYACCIDLGFEADTTRANAAEVTAWVEEHRLHSIRLVTAGYHVPRARAELLARLPKDVVVVDDGVDAGLPLFGMLLEYAKFEAAWLRLRVRPL